MLKTVETVDNWIFFVETMIIIVFRIILMNRKLKKNLIYLT